MSAGDNLFEMDMDVGDAGEGRERLRLVGSDDEAAPQETPVPSRRRASDAQGVFGWVDAKLRYVHSLVDRQELQAQTMTVAEREMMQQYQTLDYVERYSDVHRQHLRDNPKVKATMLKTFLFLLVGVACGLVAFVIRQTIDLIINQRLAYVKHLLGKGTTGEAWVFLVFTGLLLCFISTTVVVYVWPAAAGSGIEEVIAYLNGVDMPKVFNLRTGLVKFLSCVAAVSCGLPAGPEGPLIHLGAICGAGLTQGRSTTLGCKTSFFKSFRNANDHRAFITAGAAAGISAAFGAPIGGLLFVMEEMSTHWNGSMTLYIFFTCLTAFSTVSLFNSAFEAWTPTHTFGEFLNKAAVLFEVQAIIPLNVVAIFPAFLIGTLGGLFGALFTILNVRINIWRRRYLFGSNWRRVAEPCIVLTLFATLALLLPYAFECKKLTDPTIGCEGAVNATACKGRRPIGTEEQGLLATYMCKPGEYSPLGTLTLNSNEETIRRLFSRGTNNEFGWLPLLVYFVLYFTFACWTAGMSISSGLLLPMIVMGATIGRFIGHLMVVSLLADDPFVATNQWIDPGVFALIGSGAFVGGVSRLTVSLVVIMLEISGELHFLLPIMLAVITSGWVANFITPSLYHCYLDIKNVPIMPIHQESHVLDLSQHTALDATPRAPLTFKVTERVLKICETLKMTTHNCFPIVSDSGAFEGTILRSDIVLLLRTPKLFVPEGSGAEVRPLAYDDLTFTEDEYWDVRKTQVDWLSKLRDEDLRCTINLGPYLNRSPFTVQSHFSLDLTYDLFTSLGLRHLIVIKRTKCMGVITRKDLLEAVLAERLKPGAVSEYYASNRPEWYAFWIGEKIH